MHLTTMDDSALRPARRISGPRSTPTAVDLLRSARQRVLTMYGPCAAASPTVLASMARRTTELMDLPAGPKTDLLAELESLLHPGALACDDEITASA
ncbi:MAG: hypothetical protein U0572_16335 [Phycisphaerales bacterium]